MNKPTINAPVIALMGPTCSGKTGLAIALADYLPVDIISVDSALVYRGLDIGTAKPTLAERAQVPHYLIDIRDPTEIYTAADFVQDALAAIHASHQRERIPVLVGGTFFYFNALLRGLSPLPPADLSIRQQIAARAEQQGWLALHAELQAIDPIAAARIHPTDPQRLQRALEVYHQTGRTLTEWFQQEKSGNILPAHMLIAIGLIPSRREWLHERIAQRFNNMLAEGFIEEVQRLKNRADITADLPALKAVGYRQTWDYLSGKLSLVELSGLVTLRTRQLAKRQLTWLRSLSIDKVFDPETKTLCHDLYTFVTKQFFLNK